MGQEMIMLTLNELRKALPMEAKKFLEAFRKRTGCEAVFSPTNDYQHFELSSSATLELYDKRVLAIFCDPQSEKTYEAVLKKVLFIVYRKPKGLAQSSYLLYYETDSAEHA
jgi:hypothetical protein